MKVISGVYPHGDGFKQYPPDDLLEGPVAVPVGFTYVLPFTVIHRSGRFFEPLNWDVSSLAPVGAGKTYYVSKIGDDTTGLSWVRSFASIETAITQADVDIVHIGPGEYGWTTGGWRGQNPARSISLYGHGTVIITNRQSGLVWALDIGGGRPNTYIAALVAPVGACWDGRIPDMDNDFTPLTLQANANAVEANPGSWYSDGASVWVRLADDDLVDDNTWVFRSNPNGSVLRDSITLYLENISFYGGVNGAFYARCATAAGGLRIYGRNSCFKYSELRGFATEGTTESIVQNCSASRNASDGFNYHVLNTVNPDAIEINCLGRYNGTTGPGGVDQNGSAMHEAGRICRIMGEYSYNYGPNIVDTDTSLSWNLGSECHHSVCFVADTRRCNFEGLNLMWLDRVWSHDSLFDLVNFAGDTMYYHVITSGGVDSIGGSLLPY